MEKLVLQKVCGGRSAISCTKIDIVSYIELDGSVDQENRHPAAPDNKI